METDAGVCSVTMRSFQPSPSRSAARIPFTSLPAVVPSRKSTFGLKEAGIILPPPSNVGLKGCEDLIDVPVVLLIMVILSYEAPTGTVTVKEVADALVTVAATPPK